MNLVKPSTSNVYRAPPTYPSDREERIPWPRSRAPWGDVKNIRNPWDMGLRGSGFRVQGRFTCRSLGPGAAEM